jgi:hypothetical protein
MADEVWSLEELLAYLRRFEDQIYVLEQTAPEHWESIALSNLTPELWAEHIVRFIRGGQVPKMTEAPPAPGIGRTDEPVPGDLWGSADRGESVSSPPGQG